jgi:hypothetical protein
MFSPRRKALDAQAHAETNLVEPSGACRGKTPAGHKATKVATPRKMHLVSQGPYC